MTLSTANIAVSLPFSTFFNLLDILFCFQEWVLASRVAAPDVLGLRICGRTTVRPSPCSSNKGRVSWAFDVGSLVDAWWHDGWWEGIVLKKESENKIHVYFPGL